MGGGNGQDDSDDDSDRDDQELPSLESVGSDGSSELSLISGNSPNLRSPPSAGGSPDGNPSSATFSPPQPSSLTHVQPPPLSLTESMDLVNNILADSSLDRTERIDKLESLLTDMTEAFSGNGLSPSSRDRGTSGCLYQETNTFPVKKQLCDASTQTVSTGDINITKVYCDLNVQQQNLISRTSSTGTNHCI